MRVIRIDSDVDPLALFQSRRILDCLEKSSDWIFAAIDINPIQNLRYIFSQSSLNSALFTTLSQLPLVRQIYPAIDCFLIPNDALLFQGFISKVTELARIYSLSEVCRDTIGTDGVSLVAPAGVSKKGTITWAYQMEDNFFQIMPQTEEDCFLICQTLDSINIGYSITNSADVGINWIGLFRDGTNQHGANFEPN